MWFAEKMKMGRWAKKKELFINFFASLSRSAQNKTISLRTRTSGIRTTPQIGFTTCVSICGEQTAKFKIIMAKL